MLNLMLKRANSLQHKSNKKVKLRPPKLLRVTGSFNLPVNLCFFPAEMVCSTHSMQMTNVLKVNHSLKKDSNLSRIAVTICPFCNCSWLMLKRLRKQKAIKRIAGMVMKMKRNRRKKSLRRCLSAWGMIEV